VVLYLTEGFINESVAGDEVVKAIDNRVGVLITYSGENNNHGGVRYIEPYVYGATTQNNPAIRAYQYYGDTKRGVPKWKLFRLDRIESWEPTENHFELEPKARGWAAQAFNGNDKLLPTIYKVVELGEEPLTDLERLRAKTRQLQQNKPINIKQLQQNQNQGNQQPVQQEPKQSGPIGNPTPANGPEKPDNVGSQPQQSQPVKQQKQQTQPDNTENPPIQQEPKQNGPIVGNTTNQNGNESSENDKFINNMYNWWKNKPESEKSMSDEQFRDMIKRNLELTQKEKEKRGLNVGGSKLKK